MYVSNIRELIEYVVKVFKERRFLFSVQYVLWVIADRIRGVDYVKNEGHSVLDTTEEESSVFQATRDIKYLKNVLDNMNITDTDAIIDIGCGKGYLLKQFAQYPFKKVGGVEISERLCKIAKKNMEKERINNCYIYNENAKSFIDYAEYNYIYMFNPFPSVVMKAVMKNLIGELKNNKKMYIIYHNPVCHMDVIEGNHFKLVNKYRGKSTEYYVYESVQ